MIVHVAGTSGAGKSWVIRQLMRQAVSLEPIDVVGRRAHIGYNMSLAGVWKQPSAPGPEFTEPRLVFVVGSYEAPTGGCDTIKDAEQNYKLVRDVHWTGRHVLYEGLFVMNHTRGLALARDVGSHLVTIQLTTPLEECFAHIASRRAEQGKTEPVARKNTEGNFTRCLNYCSKMRQAGHQVIKASSTEAPEIIYEIFKKGEP